MDLFASYKPPDHHLIAAKSVTATLDMEKELGFIKCSQCLADFSARISHLTEPIDLYHDWIDKCENEA
jgi:transcription elongation factor Elf1